MEPSEEAEASTKPTSWGANDRLFTEAVCMEETYTCSKTPWVNTEWQQRVEGVGGDVIASYRKWQNSRWWRRRESREASGKVPGFRVGVVLW